MSRLRVALAPRLPVQYQHISEIQQEADTQRNAIWQFRPPAAPRLGPLRRFAAPAAGHQLQVGHDLADDARVSAELPAEQDDDQPEHAADDRAETERPEYDAQPVQRVRAARGDGGR